MVCGPDHVTPVGRHERAVLWGSQLSARSSVSTTARLALALGILISMVGTSRPVAADDLDFRHLRVFALGAFGNYTVCSFQPEVPCEQWIFLIFREPRVYEGGSGIARPHTPWSVF